jgi:hypothetical protein
MTPEERRAYILDLARVREEAKREAYEDAARIREIKNLPSLLREQLQAAIRARIKA